MYENFFGEGAKDVLKRLEDAANEKQIDFLKGFYNGDFLLKIEALKKTAHSLGYELNFELEEKDFGRLLYSSVARALAKDYSSVYYVDLTTDSYEEYVSDAHYARLNIKKKGEDFFKECEKNVNQFVYEKDREKVLALLDKTRLMRELAEDETDIFTYRLIYDNKPIYMKIKIIRLKNGDKDCLIIGIRNVDAQVKRRIEYELAKEERVTFSRIAQALARDYLAVYYVDADTDEYVLYRFGNEYDGVKTEKSGKNFFNECVQDICRNVHDADKQKLILTMNKNALMSETENDNVFTVTFRIKEGKKTVHAILKALRMDDKYGHHFLIGIENIDDQIKRENVFLDAIYNAKQLANKDTLTGTLNKLAYDEREKELNLAIVNGGDKEFAIVVCDINDLKIINDRRGHKVGNESIKEAANTISEIFDGVPIYRIGGDEFVLFLQGKDYLKRKFLVKTMNEKMRKNRDKNLLVIACGMAEYTSEDGCVEEVFERADEEMYADKYALKRGK